MNTWTKYDRATMALGFASIASLASLLLSGDLRFVLLSGAAIVVAIVLGVVAILSGALMQPRLAALTGLAFLVAAILQVVLVTLRENWLGGNTATAALWLGLGVGLVVVAIARLASDPSRMADITAGPDKTPEEI